MNPTIEVNGLAKTFVLHQQNGVVLDVLSAVHFHVLPGQCLVLLGRSGAGKSTLLRTLYANYRPMMGSIRVRHEGQMLELVGAETRDVQDVRRKTMGYISQFLRVIPRVSCLNVVMEPALQRGVPLAQAEERARALLRRLNIDDTLFSLAPGTFSGGEQQRVNIARSFMVDWPLILLDEPTSSLDQTNREVVLDLIAEAKAAGSAMIAISHEEQVRDRIADRFLDMSIKEHADAY